MFAVCIVLILVCVIHAVMIVITVVSWLVSYMHCLLCKSNAMLRHFSVKAACSKLTLNCVVVWQ